MVGDTTECAVLRSMAQLMDKAEEYVENRRKVFEVPFNSTNKWQLSIHELDIENDPKYLVVMKVVKVFFFKYSLIVCFNFLKMKFT